MNINLTLKFIAFLLLMLLLSFLAFIILEFKPGSSHPPPAKTVISLTPLPPSLTHTPTETSSPSPSDSNNLAGTSTDTHTLTDTPPPLITATNTPLPAKTIVRAEVLERANCRYGPGSVYLYKYGLVPGSNMDVIGRIESNMWVYIQAIGGSNPCWVYASLVKITGDLATIEIVYPNKALLPISPGSTPVSWVKAVRNDATITVSWDAVPFYPGDEEDEFMQHYIVEVWRCEAGQIIFEPIGTNELFVSFIDQYGYGLPSHGRVYVQKKNGFAGPVEIPWP